MLAISNLNLKYFAVIYKRLLSIGRLAVFSLLKFQLQILYLFSLQKSSEILKSK